MKKVMFIIISLILFISCSQSSVKTEQDKSISSVDTSHYVYSRELKGLSNFIIGKSSINDCQKEISKSYETFKLWYDCNENTKGYYVKCRLGLIDLNIMLYFYKDVLYKIETMDEISCMDIYFNYIKKYGNGVEYEQLYHNYIKWENENIIAIYNKQKIEILSKNNDIINIINKDFYDYKTKILQLNKY